MYQEFNQHKKSDAVKWIIAFTLIIVLMAGVVAALILSLDKPTPIKPQENGTQQESPDESNASVVLTIGQPKLMSVKSPALAADNTQQYVSQTVTATITPSTVVDKYVTWSVAWANDAPLKDKNISDYIKVTDDSQGNLTATVNCYKSFKGSKAILTCTTRQGGKTGTVNIVYEGVPSSMSITAPTGVTKYNLGKDSVDLLYVGKSYSLNLAMDNIFHSVGSNYNDFTVTVTGVGSVTCGSYSQSGRGAGWSSHSNILSSKKKKYMGIILCLYTGLRIGELLALTWNDIDLAKGILSVNKTCHDASINGNHVRVIDTPKTENSRRQIPLSKSMIRTIKEMKKYSQSEYIIADGKDPVFVRSYQRTFELLLHKLSIPHKGFHSLRHTFATRALECGKRDCLKTDNLSKVFYIRDMFLSGLQPIRHWL